MVKSLAIALSSLIAFSIQCQAETLRLRCSATYQRWPDEPERTAHLLFEVDLRTREYKSFQDRGKGWEPNETSTLKDINEYRLEFNLGYIDRHTGEFVIRQTNWTYKGKCAAVPTGTKLF